MQYYENRGGFLSQIPTVTKNLLLINILVFIMAKISPDFMYKSFALFYPTSPYFHVWQLVTHMFMHGDFFHILCNMYMLVMFGSAVERTIGSRKMLKLYFIAGFGAVLLHFGVMYLQVAYYEGQIAAGVADAIARYSAVKMTPTVGASGAIYGLLIAYALIYPNQRMYLLFPPIPMKAITLVIIFAVIELFAGVRGLADGIAHFAHLGGMLFGWLMIRYWKKNNTLFDEYMG